MILPIGTKHLTFPRIKCLVYIVRHIITVRFPFTYPLIPPGYFASLQNLFMFLIITLLYAS